MRLEGKVAVVTGATRGIGAAIAHQLAAEGASVVLTGRTEEAGREIESQILRDGGQALFVRADHSHREEVAALIETTVRAFGSLTTLVNNAARQDLEDGTALTVDDDVIAEMMQVHLHAAVWACRAAIPHMERAGGGSIINISTIGSMFPRPGALAYAVSKGAVNSLTLQLAVDHAGANIRANALILGRIAAIPRLYEDPAFRASSAGLSLLARVGKPEEVAGACAFLASDDADFITGALLPVDGGTMLKRNELL